jgi:hypothetical protein
MGDSDAATDGLRHRRIGVSTLLRESREDLLALLR